ncbi:MAG: redoxin domain-containing protein [Candidatus Omnitrophica bacterium]|nr:redoxin domain-containing protein [Candidatus Omnitrophota bacterium]
MKLKLFTIAVLSVCVLSACTPADTQGLGGAGKAPDFTLKDLAGNEISLSEVLKTKEAAVLVFGASWCPYCVREIPEVNDYYTDKGDSVGIIGVNIQESPAKVASFVERTGIKYPMALDLDGRVASAYRVRGIPAVIAVNSEGEIVYRGHNIVDMQRETGL